MFDLEEYTQDRRYKLASLLGSDIFKLEDYKRKFILNGEINKELEEETKKNSVLKTLDNRDYKAMNINLIIGDIAEDYILLRLPELEKNIKATHGRTLNAHNYSDFKYKDYNIEFQFSFKEIEFPLIKEYKLNNLLKENAFLLQGKYNNGKPLYKLINLSTAKFGKEIERYPYKKEKEITSGEWQTLEQIKKTLVKLAS